MVQNNRPRFHQCAAVLTELGVDPSEIYYLAESYTETDGELQWPDAWDSAQGFENWPKVYLRKWTSNVDVAELRSTRIAIAFIIAGFSLSACSWEMACVLTAFWLGREDVPTLRESLPKTAPTAVVFWTKR